MKERAEEPKSEGRGGKKKAEAAEALPGEDRGLGQARRALILLEQPTWSMPSPIDADGRGHRSVYG
jgi:hypothetical protein